MSNDLQGYLASKYMSGPKAEAILATNTTQKKKKKKKKVNSQILEQTSSYSGLVLRDADEEVGWKSGPGDDDLEVEPVVEQVTSFKSKKPNDSNWQVIKPSQLQDDQEKQLEEEEREDEKPQVVETLKGGLQTAAQIKAKLVNQPPISKRIEKEAEMEQEEETIYRDSSGKKIDTKQMRAEEKRRQARELEKKMKKMEWGKGLVQRKEKKMDAEELEKMASQPFARTIDDKALNEELKNQQRWNDPAAAFLTKPINSSSTKSQTPKYNGPPPPPNRYGILPGFRWDGVDRSNGFEKKLFQTNNDQKRLRSEAYNYSVDEM